MAITATHYELLQRYKPLIPQHCRVLQIGEANWYGDLDHREVGLVGQTLFEIALDCYCKLCDPRRIVAIDFSGTSTAWKYDLNQPLPPLGNFDLVINNGTAEHIFDIAQVFRSMHDACEVDGLMIHEGPFTGWQDHGFYCLQPTLFYDIAAANGYEIVGVHIEQITDQIIIDISSREELSQAMLDGKIPNNAMLFVVLRKVREGAFVVPMQGYYSRTIGESGRQAWEALR